MNQTNLYVQRNKYWYEINKYFGNFPSSLFHQAVLLTHNLALNYSDDAQFHNILRRRQDYPLLDQHFWLLDDWGISETNQREVFENNLMLAMVFNFMALNLQKDIADPFSQADQAFYPLQQILNQRADFHFKQLFSVSSPFWIHHQKAQTLSQSHAPQPDPLSASGHWAFTSLSMIASALWADKESQLPQLLEMSEHLRIAFQTISQLSSLRIDLRDGRVTLPIQRAIQAVGVTDVRNLSAEYFFGIMIFSGTLEKICVENHVRIEFVRLIAQTLNLPSFVKFCNSADALLHQIRNQFGLKKQEREEGEALRTFFAPAIDVTSNVIQKAEGYLLSDLNFRQAWEVQQKTFKDFPLLLAQAFPSALILEVLGSHGHDISKQADLIFKLYQENDFRYYDIPETLVPDIDNVGFALRIYPYSSHSAVHKDLLQTPLRWVRENQKPDGQIPVWLWRNNSRFQISPLVVLYGNNCATVEANLMIGMIDFDWENFQDVITACAASWCTRWLSLGLGATEHYTPLFSLWTSLELISKLLKQGIDQSLRDDLNKVAAQICERIRLEAGQPNLTPQSVSFLILARLCKSDWQSDLPFNPNWLTVLYKHQQWDGKWAGEPIYVAPSGRGLGTFWYKSHTITTAFCYHALKTYQIMDNKG